MNVLRDSYKEDRRSKIRTRKDFPECDSLKTVQDANSLWRISVTLYAHFLCHLDFKHNHVLKYSRKVRTDIMKKTN